MPFNGSGVFVRLYTWVNDAAANIKIRADRMDNEMNGIATALSNCITKDGQTTVTANLPMAGYRHTGVGNATSRNQYSSYAQLQDGKGLPTVGGTVDAITLSYSIPHVSYSGAMEISWVQSGANTGAVTVDVDGLGVKSVTKNGSTPLVAGDLPSGEIVYCLYDGTRFQLINDVQLGADSVATTNITNGAVTRPKLATGAVAPVNVTGSKTANYTATTDDDFIPCDATSSAFTVTLYAASGNAGREITIKKTDSTFNVVTIDANASETIDGALTRRLCTQNEAITLACDGTNWYVKNRVIPAIWTTYTPTITHISGGITNNTNTFRYRRNGDSIEIMGTIAFASASAAFSGIFIALPSGLSVDTAKMTTATSLIQPIGQLNFLDSGVATYKGDLLYNSAGTLEMQVFNSAGTYTAGNVPSNAIPFTFGAADAIGITTHRIPVTNWEG